FSAVSQAKVYSGKRLQSTDGSLYSSRLKHYCPAYQGDRNMKARTKFLIGGLLVMSTAGYLMASSARDTAVYYLTPAELEARLEADPGFRDAPMKIGANVVRGSIVRQPGGRELSFLMTDGEATYPVVYRGVPPDTFTDTEDVEVVVTGRLDAEGTFQATEL